MKQYGFKLWQGTIVGVTIIAAAPSAKNKAKARDQEEKEARGTSA